MLTLDGAAPVCLIASVLTRALTKKAGLSFTGVRFKVGVARGGMGVAVRGGVEVGTCVPGGVEAGVAVRSGVEVGGCVPCGGEAGVAVRSGVEDGVAGAN